jgi:peptide/nickel transport system permease protein
MTAVAVPRASALSRLRDTAIRLRPGTVVPALLVLALVVAILAPAVLTHRSPTAVDLEHTLLPPSLSHPFGTDDAGRDLRSPTPCDRSSP